MTAGRLGVGVVGAGRVGAVLGARLAGVGHAIVGFSATSEASLERAAALLPGVPVLDVPTLIERSELVLLTVPDAELSGLVQGLADAGAWHAGQLVVHVAAAHGTEILAPARAQGAIPLALHPVLDFTGTSIDLSRLRDAVVAVSAPAPVLPIGQALVVELGAEPVVIADADRPAFAAALGTVRDYSRAVVADASGALTALGVERPDRVLQPLLRSVVDDALTRAVATGRVELDRLRAGGNGAPDASDESATRTPDHPQP